MDHAGNLYLITRRGLAIRYAESGVWEEEEYRTNVSSDCATAWGYANGLDVGDLLMWKYADDLDVDKTTGALYAIFTGNPEYKSVLIKRDAGQLTCWPQGTGPVDAALYSVDISPDGLQVWVGGALGASRYIESEGWRSFLNAELNFSAVRQVGFELNDDGYDALIMTSDGLSDLNDNGQLDEDESVIITTKISPLGFIETGLDLNDSSHLYTESSSGSLGVKAAETFSPVSSLQASKYQVIQVQGSDEALLQRAHVSHDQQVFSYTFDPQLYEVNDDGSLSASAYRSPALATTTQVTGAARAEDGSYWLTLSGAEGGGLYSSALDFTYTTASGLHTEQLTSIAVDQGGVVWLGTQQGLVRLRNGQFEQLSETAVHGVVVDANNQVWTATDDGVYAYDGAELVAVLDDTDTPLCERDWHFRDGPAAALTVAVDPLGDAWVSCAHRVYQHRAGIWSVYAGFGVESLDFFSTGEVWAGGGVGIFDDGGVWVRHDAGGASFTRPESPRQGWTTIYGGLAVTEGVTSGTNGLEVGGQYVIQPCADSESGCPRLGWLPIEGGTYQMSRWGSDRGATSLDYTEGTEVTLSDFELMRTEVTYEMINGCWRDGVCRFGDSELGAPEVYQGVNDRYLTEMGHPSVNMTWVNLQAFARWAGARLPSESEWEYAARSRGQTVTFPWGAEDPTCDYLDYRLGFTTQCRGLGTSKVCLTPLGSTDQGVCDMSGNLREIVQDHYYSTIEEIPSDGAGNCLNGPGCRSDLADDEARTSRGGHYGGFVLEVRAAVRSAAPALVRQDWQHGGRLARSIP